MSGRSQLGSGSARRRDFTAWRDDLRFLPLSVQTNPFVPAVAANCSSVLNRSRHKNAYTYIYIYDRSDVYILPDKCLSVSVHPMRLFRAVFVLHAYNKHTHTHTPSRS